jgi:outer membrane immunogenic protein
MSSFIWEYFVKKIAAALFTVALSCTAASAADLPARTYTKAPPVAVYDWSGFYVGLNAGGAWGASNATSSTIFSPTGYFPDTTVVSAVNSVGNQNLNRTSFTGGVTGGYNWQISSAVVGVEGDFNYLGFKKSLSGTAVYPGFAPFGFTVNSSVSADWLATLRGRVGFLATPSLLLYGTGGLAVANVRSSYLFTDAFGSSESASISTTRYGWTAGAGGEYALLNGWSIKAEYLYVDLGRASTTSGSPIANQPFTHTVNLRENIGRVGINYKFGGPVSAKY